MGGTFLLCVPMSARFDQVEKLEQYDLHNGFVLWSTFYVIWDYVVDIDLYAWFFR
jgi:hypothetical protein